MLTPSLKIDYTLHDLAYRSKKEAGLPGWNTAEETAEQINHLQDLLSRCVLPAAARVLDIGCGAGNLSFWLASQGYQVTGIDVSPTAIAWAQEQALANEHSCAFHILDACRTDSFAAAPFDLIIDNHCLHCIIGTDRPLYLRHIFLNLRQGGNYICNTMCDHVGDPYIQSSFDPLSRCLMRGDTAVRYIGRHEDIIIEVQTAGFTLKHIELYPHPVQDSLSFIAKRL